jgi:hypothetical protein
MSGEAKNGTDEVLRDQVVEFECLLTDLRVLGESIELAGPGVRVALPYFRAHRLERLLTEAVIKVERSYWQRQEEAQLEGVQGVAQ